VKGKGQAPPGKRDLRRSSQKLQFCLSDRQPHVASILPTSLAAVSALTLLVDRREDHSACKKYVVRRWRGYLAEVSILSSKNTSVINNLCLPTRRSKARCDVTAVWQVLLLSAAERQAVLVGQRRVRGPSKTHVQQQHHRKDC